MNFTSLKALDPELVSQLRERLPDPLFEKLNGSLSIDQDRLKFAEYKIRVLEERLRLVRIEGIPRFSKTGRSVASDRAQLASRVARRAPITSRMHVAGAQALTHLKARNRRQHVAR